MNSYDTYHKLAWVEEILAPFNEVKKEALLFANLIKKHLPNKDLTLLHFGCGAGRHDFFFKRHFTVTGVDLSENMLNIAKLTNPEITYIKGDMRSLSLNKQFDVVTIPDAIDYMVTRQDLNQLISNALNHLHPKGIIFIVCKTKEQYQDNDFIYHGEKDGITVILHEINKLLDEQTYQAVFNYQIKKNNDVETITDIHTLGLFSHQIWLDVFNDHQLKVTEVSLNHLYDKYVQNDGQYAQTGFIVFRK